MCKITTPMMIFGSSSISREIFRRYFLTGVELLNELFYRLELKKIHIV